MKNDLNDWLGRDRNNDLDHALEAQSQIALQAHFVAGVQRF